jgi:hypothetical protein
MGIPFDSYFRLDALDLGMHLLNSWACLSELRSLAAHDNALMAQRTLFGLGGAWWREAWRHGIYFCCELSLFLGVADLGIRNYDSMQLAS